MPDEESYQKGYRKGSLKGACAAYQNAIKDALSIRRGTQLEPAGKLREKFRDALTYTDPTGDFYDRVVELAKQRGDTVRIFDRASGRTVISATKSGERYIFRFPR